MATGTSDWEPNPRRWYVLITVGLGTLLSSLNTSMINTILPVIERALHVPMSQSAWIVLIYLLVLTLFLLPMGRMADLFGYRPLFLSGFVVFIGATILCGLAQDYRMLLVGRALLAMAGAAILAVGPALISTTFSPEQRGQVLGLQAVMTYLGLSVGPVLGGWLADWRGWPFTFFVTIPFALIGFLLGLWSVPSASMKRQRSLDLAGILLFMIAMASITFLLNANAVKNHRSVVELVLTVCFLGSAAMFVRAERRHPEPMIQLSLFRIRNFGFGTVGAAFNYLCFFLALFLLPFYFSNVLHHTAAMTGTYLSISPLVMMVCAPIAGAISDRIGPRILITMGMLMSTASLVLFACMGHSSPAWSPVFLIVGLVFAGLGTGTFAAPNNSAILGAAPRHQQGVASGTLATFRYIGMMAGITLGGSLFDTIQRDVLSRNPNGTDAFLTAFVSVMWIGAIAGAVGVVCTLCMASPSRVSHPST